MSLDALRGFDMFWIAGGGFIVSALDRWTDNPLLNLLKEQLSHVAWEGFRFYDLIFPLFVFIVGVSVVYSVRKGLTTHGRWPPVRRILVRGALLFVIGLFYSGGFSQEWPNLRVLGVLNRIAICYTITGLLFVFFRPRWLVAVFVLLLAGYWGAMTYVPIRDIQLEPAALARVAAKLAPKKGETKVVDTNAVALFQGATKTISGQYGPGYNLANHLDFQYLPGRKHDTYYDPEGLLSTFPAIATCLLGVFAGLWLQSGRFSPEMKSVGLITAGFILMSAGYLWGFQFPVVKKLWTSSFVLVAGGYSLMLMGVFHHVVDVWGWRRWCQPFVWIGANALTIYLASQILNFRKVAERFTGGPIKTGLGAAGETVLALTAVMFLFWFARFLYQRKIFLRL